jgi:hypothetical protein
MLSSLVHQIVPRLARALRELAHGYRPERHYMRGPGPKWRKRHGRI